MYSTWYVRPIPHGRPGRRCALLEYRSSVLELLGELARAPDPGRADRPLDRRRDHRPDDAVGTDSIQWWGKVFTDQRHRREALELVRLAQSLGAWAAMHFPHERASTSPTSSLAPGARKDPFYVHLRDQPLFGVAGIWERKRGEDGAEGLSCALITLPANELLTEVHNGMLRMPAALRDEDHAAWLTGSPEQAKEAFDPYPSDRMEAWRVSRRQYANKVPDDGALIERVGQ